mgnify:CR=1 FL=1
MATSAAKPSSASCSDAHAERLSAAQLGAEITELCAYIYAAQARLLELIREFDENKYWQDLGLCSCAHWLNIKCSIGMNAAREKVRVAHALAELPKIAERFSTGALSYSKVRAMTRVATPENESFLLDIAHYGTAHHVEKLIARFRTCQRLQDAQLADDQYRERELNYHYDHDGCLVIKARVPAEQGALLIKALDKAMDQQDETKNLAEPIAARRADALNQVAQTYMNNSESSGSSADRYQVVVHTTVKETSEQKAEPDVTAVTPHLEKGPGLCEETANRIACDCSVVHLKQDEDGEPLSIGRRSRSIPPPMRRALIARDGGCRFPGCTHTRFVHGHHIKHWSAGGETSLGNLVLLCSHHHHLVHEGGFVCEKDKEGKVQFKNPRKEPLAHWSLSPRLTTSHDIKDWLDEEYFEQNIDADTCVSQWYAGDRMDWDLAVAGLFQLAA